MEENSKDDVTVKEDDVKRYRKVSLPDRDEYRLFSMYDGRRTTDDIHVGEEAVPNLKPSRTQQTIPDASGDARLDLDLGSMTALKWNQDQLQELVCKSAVTLFQQEPSGTPPQDTIL